MADWQSVNDFVRSGALYYGVRLRFSNKKIRNKTSPIGFRRLLVGKIGCILVMDPWSLEIPSIRRLMEEFDSGGFVKVTLVIDNSCRPVLTLAQF